MTTIFAALLLAAGATLGCGGKADDSGPPGTGAGETAAPGDTDTGPPLEDQESASSFTDGQYRTTALVVLEEGEGIDLDGDDEIDNNLPAVLEFVDAAGPLFGLKDDLSPAGVNATLAASIKAGDLLLLLEGSQEGALLTLDLLLGVEDKGGNLSVDPASYEGDTPTSRLTGSFSSETEFTATSDLVQIPFSFFPDEPPLFIPVAEVTLVGELGDDSSGKLYGAVPVQGVLDQVIAPLLADQKDKDELLEGINELIASGDLADIELEDGTLAFSAAMSYQASGVSW